MKSLFEEAEVLFNQGNLEQSKKICQKILKNDPKDLNSLILISVIAFKTNNLIKSIEIIDYSIKLFPEIPELYFNKAHVLTMKEDYQTSLENINKSISLRNNYYEAYNLKGLILLKQKQNTDAIKSFENAIKINPNFFEAYKNLFIYYKNYEQNNNAEKILNKAEEVFKNYHELFWLKSAKYKDEKKLDDSLEEINKAIKINPNISESFNLRGLIYKDLGKHNESEKDFIKSIKIDKNNYQAHHNLGNLLKNKKKFSDSIIYYKKAVEINKFHKNGFGNYLLAKNSICDWDSYDSNCIELINLVKSKNNVCSAFNLFSIVDSNELHLINAQLENKNFSVFNSDNKKIEISNNNKIKIAYYSADFRNHPVSKSIVELIEKHDRNKFEIIGISFNSIKDQTKLRMVDAFDKFIEVEKKSVDEIVNLSKNLKIDIAIDLMGYTKDSRFAIFEKRCAPIQINYLGFPGTTASKNMDYIIADKCVINENESVFFSEKIINLPISFMVTDTKRKPSKKLFDYRNYEFPLDSIVLCSFNTYYKITPKIFDIWCNILLKFKKTVLWLSQENIDGIQNLTKEIEKKGINKNRLFFAKFENRIEDHLARIKLADLCLDTYPYSSHSTTFDYLVSGTPLVTLKGNSFVSKVSSSILESFNLQDLITNSYSEYENKICELISSPKKIIELKENIKNKMTSSTLFDINKYIKNIEKSYEIVYRNKINGLPLKNIIID
tara:strand:- start:3992 stop:6163 length:2172 start_codon:yes stop_codon:yes gene_type:complete